MINTTPKKGDYMRTTLFSILRWTCLVYASHKCKAATSLYAGVITNQRIHKGLYLVTQEYGHYVKVLMARTKGSAPPYECITQKKN